MRFPLDKKQDDKRQQDTRYYRDWAIETTHHGSEFVANVFSANDDAADCSADCTYDDCDARPHDASDECDLAGCECINNLFHAIPFLLLSVF